MTVIVPETHHVSAILTALSPISHHDPAAQDGSNMLTFNRMKQTVKRNVTPGPIEQATVDAFCTAHPVPFKVVDAVKALPFSQFVACALVKTALDMYNGHEGTGLFSGLGRYEMLESRLHSAAVRSTTILQLWNRVCHDLQWPINYAKHDDLLLAFFSLPLTVQSAATAALATEYRTVSVIARLWHSETKKSNEAYATAMGLPMPGLDQVEVIRYSANDMAENLPSLVVEVPAITTNSLRHQMVRAPGWRHLAGMLGLETKTINVNIEAMFENGGNIRAGEKQPRDAWALAQAIREKYPLLDLLGGVANSFDLGESKLKMVNWLVCKENSEALNNLGYDLPGMYVSAFDMLDDVTATRQATERGVGQMIYNFETLPTGTQIVVHLALLPFTSRLTAGALGAALATFNETIPVIAGQGSRGYGHARAEYTGATLAEQTDEYEDYLRDNVEELRGYIYDCTLGSGAVVVS